MRIKRLLSIAYTSPLSVSHILLRRHWIISSCLSSACKWQNSPSPSRSMTVSKIFIKLKGPCCWRCLWFPYRQFCVASITPFLPASPFLNLCCSLLASAIWKDKHCKSARVQRSRSRSMSKVCSTSSFPISQGRPSGRPKVFKFPHTILFLSSNVLALVIVGFCTFRIFKRLHF